jgi:hypothetical protein
LGTSKHDWILCRDLLKDNLSEFMELHTQNIIGTGDDKSIQHAMEELIDISYRLLRNDDVMDVFVDECNDSSLEVMLLVEKFRDLDTYPKEAAKLIKKMTKHIETMT